MHTHLTHLSLQATLHSLQSPLPHPPLQKLMIFNARGMHGFPFLCALRGGFPIWRFIFCKYCLPRPQQHGVGCTDPDLWHPSCCWLPSTVKLQMAPVPLRAPFCSVTNSLSHALVLPTSPTSVICQPPAPGSVDILTSGVDAKPCCEYHVWLSSSFWDLGLLQGRMCLCNVTLGEGI